MVEGERAKSVWRYSGTGNLRDRHGASRFSHLHLNFFFCNAHLAYKYDVRAKLILKDFLRVCLTSWLVIWSDNFLLVGFITSPDIGTDALPVATGEGGIHYLQLNSVQTNRGWIYLGVPMERIKGRYRYEKSTRYQGVFRRHQMGVAPRW
jgi:hypothetical protein